MAAVTTLDKITPMCTHEKGVRRRLDYDESVEKPRIELMAKIQTSSLEGTVSGEGDVEDEATETEYTVPERDPPEPLMDTEIIIEEIEDSSDLETSKRTRPKETNHSREALKYVFFGLEFGELQEEENVASGIERMEISDPLGENLGGFDPSVDDLNGDVFEPLENNRLDALENNRLDALENNRLDALENNRLDGDKDAETISYEYNPLSKRRKQKSSLPPPTPSPSRVQISVIDPETETKPKKPEFGLTVKEWKALDLDFRKVHKKCTECEFYFHVNTKYPRHMVYAHGHDPRILPKPTSGQMSKLELKRLKAEIGLTMEEWNDLSFDDKRVRHECPECKRYFGIRHWAPHVVEEHGYDPRTPEQKKKTRESRLRRQRRMEKEKPGKNKKTWAKAKEHEESSRSSVDSNENDDPDEIDREDDMRVEEKDDDKNDRNDIMRKELSCPVCGEIMVEPALLVPCNHGTCMECAYRVVSCGESTGQKCPICETFAHSYRHAPFTANLVAKFFPTLVLEKKGEREKGVDEKTIEVVLKNRGEAHGLYATRAKRGRETVWDSFTVRVNPKDTVGSSLLPQIKSKFKIDRPKILWGECSKKQVHLSKRFEDVLPRGAKTCTFTVVTETNWRNVGRGHPHLVSHAVEEQVYEYLKRDMRNKDLDTWFDGKRMIARVWELYEENVKAGRDFF